MNTTPTPNPPEAIAAGCAVICAISLIFWLSIAIAVIILF